MSFIKTITLTLLSLSLSVSLYATETEGEDKSTLLFATLKNSITPSSPNYDTFLSEIENLEAERKSLQEKFDTAEGMEKDLLARQVFTLNESIQTLQSMVNGEEVVSEILTDPKLSPTEKLDLISAHPGLTHIEKADAILEITAPLSTEDEDKAAPLHFATLPSDSKNMNGEEIINDILADTKLSPTEKLELIINNPGLTDVEKINAMLEITFLLSDDETSPRHSAALARTGHHRILEFLLLNGEDNSSQPLRSAALLGHDRILDFFVRETRNPLMKLDYSFTREKIDLINTHP